MTAPDQTPAQAPLSAERLAEIRARAEAATPGPWRQDVMYVDAVVPQGRPGGEVIIQCYPTVRHLNAVVPVKANAAFVAHSRKDVPELLAEIERLTAERRWYQRAAAEMRQMLHEAEDREQALDQAVVRLEQELAAGREALIDVRARVHVQLHGGYVVGATPAADCYRWICAVVNQALAAHTAAGDGAGEGTP